MSGKLGNWNLSAYIPQAIYVNNKTEASFVTVNVCNRNATAASIRIAISTSATLPTASEYVVFDTVLAANNSYEKQGLVVDSGKYVIVRSTAANVTASCWGMTKGIASAPAPTPVSLNTGAAPVWVSSSAVTIPATADTSIQLVANDPDEAPVTYSVTSGSLPTGLTLSSSGRITGVATGTTSTFTVTANDGTQTSTNTITATVTKAAASGGTTTFAGGYTYHTFTSSGSLGITATGVIEIIMWGGGGAGGTVGGWSYGAPGGAGGYANGKLSVTSGQTYTIVVGGGGGVNSYSYATGGGGRASNNNSDNRYAGGGGGYSGFFNGSASQANAVLIAGGGGGGGSSRAGTGNQGGAGGGLEGQDGVSPYDGKTGYRGRGGTQIAAGSQADCDSPNGGNEQAALQGGSPRSNSYGGGGGGGYWGGSAGGYSESNTMAGGGGGSGYYSGSVLSPVLTSGNLVTPGNDSSSFRSSYGNAGSVAGNGTQGVVIVRYVT